MSTRRIRITIPTEVKQELYHNCIEKDIPFHKYVTTLLMYAYDHLDEIDFED